MGLKAKASASVLAVTAMVAALAVACSGGEAEEPVGAVKAASTLGPGEGSLTLVTLPGYMENGGNDPRVDWVTPFEERTGCKVSWKVARDSQEMTGLMQNRSRRYDGVAAPPEVTGPLIAGEHAAPVNPNLVDGYKRLEPRLRNLLKKGDKVYGVPYVWGSNLLMYDSRAVQSAPSTWAALFDPDQAEKHSGRLIMRDSPLVIAEAALYLRSTQRKLKINDPYSLTRKQLDAAAKVLAEQRPHVKTYWEQPADAVSAFAGGEAAVGQVWPYQVDVLTRAGKPVQGVVPSGGVTGWMTSWMVGARAEHPNCMYQWLQWTASPDVQQQVAEWSGVAPANPQACTGDRLRATFCDTYRVGDRDYLEKVIFAHTPSKVCGSGEREGGRRDCTDYAEWTLAWHEATRQ
ncbi:ABC transporter substrate-binding protein [Actinomadura rugatobispora]|uniref:ABC transporter substrate-binding protein n=1 Tax=Actinomadura rugatobispora TaxID=1994 RepID=A0ABW1AFP3_9ACTN|nr:ABC transporter substrate-binding protein [Actinomadura rugatobispora]